MQKAWIVAAALLLTACVPEALEMSNVVPMPENEYQVTSNWRLKDQTTKWALEAADITCKKRKMRPVVLEQKIALRGVVLGEGVDPAAAEGKGDTMSPLYGRNNWTTQLRFRCET